MGQKLLNGLRKAKGESIAGAPSEQKKGPEKYGAQQKAFPHSNNDNKKLISTLKRIILVFDIIFELSFILSVHCAVFFAFPSRPIVNVQRPKWKKSRWKGVGDGSEACCLELCPHVTYTHRPTSFGFGSWGGHIFFRRSSYFLFFGSRPKKKITFVQREVSNSCLI